MRYLALVSFCLVIACGPPLPKETAESVLQRFFDNWNVGNYDGCAALVERGVPVAAKMRALIPDKDRVKFTITNVRIGKSGADPREVCCLLFDVKQSRRVQVFGYTHETASLKNVDGAWRFQFDTGMTGMTGLIAFVLDPIEIRRDALFRPFKPYSKQ